MRERLLQKMSQFILSLVMVLAIIQPFKVQAEELSGMMTIGDQYFLVDSDFETTYFLTQKDNSRSDYGMVYEEGASADNYHVKVELDAEGNVVLTLKGAVIRSISNPTYDGVSNATGRTLIVRTEGNSDNTIMGNENTTGLTSNSLIIDGQHLSIAGYGSGHGIHTGELTVTENGSIQNVSSTGNHAVFVTTGDATIKGAIFQASGNKSGIFVDQGSVYYSGECVGSIIGSKQLGIYAGKDIVLSGEINHIRGEMGGVYALGDIEISGTVKSAIYSLLGDAIGSLNDVRISGKIYNWTNSNNTVKYYAIHSASSSASAISAGNNIYIAESAYIDKIHSNNLGARAQDGDITIAGVVGDGIEARAATILVEKGKAVIKAPLYIKSTDVGAISGLEGIELENVAITLPEDGQIKSLSGRYTVVDLLNAEQAEVKFEAADADYYQNYIVLVGGVELKANAVTPCYALVAGNTVTLEGASEDNYNVKFTVNADSTLKLEFKDATLNLGDDYPAVQYVGDNDITVCGVGTNNLSSNVTTITSSSGKATLTIAGEFEKITSDLSVIHSTHELYISADINEISSEYQEALSAGTSIVIAEDANVEYMQSGDGFMFDTYGTGSVTVLSPVEMRRMSGEGLFYIKTLENGKKAIFFGDTPWYSWTKESGGTMIDSSETPYEWKYSDTYLKIADKKVSLAFDKGEGSGSMDSVEVLVRGYQLPECGFTAPEGKQFKAWEIDGKEYAADEKVNLLKSTVAKAVYECFPAELGDITVSDSKQVPYGSNDIIQVSVEENMDLYDYTYEWFEVPADSYENAAKSDEDTNTLTIEDTAVPGEYYYFARVTATRKDNGVSISKDSEIIHVEVTKAAIKDVKVEQDGTITYDRGKKTDVSVKVDAATVNSQPATILFSLTEDGPYTKQLVFDKAGKQTVYFKLSADCHEDAYGSFEVTVDEPAADPDMDNKPGTTPGTVNKLSATPNTGDDHNVFGWMIVMLVSGAVLVLAERKKRHHL